MVAVMGVVGRNVITALAWSLCGLQHASDYMARGKTCVWLTFESHRPQPRLSKAPHSSLTQDADSNTEHTQRSLMMP